MNQRIRSFDLIRILAFILILTYHFYPNILSGGFLGVNILFALSSFLVAGSFLDQEERAWRYQASRFEAGSFYRKRFYRLWPTLTLCLALVVGLSWFISKDYQVGLAHQTAAAFGGVTNYYEILTGGSYEAQFTKHLFLHTWSLGIETRFYIFFGLLGWALVTFSPPTKVRWRLAWYSILFIFLSVGLLAAGSWCLHVAQQASQATMEAAVGSLGGVSLPGTAGGMATLTPPGSGDMTWAHRILDYLGGKDRLISWLYFSDLTRMSPFFWGILAACCSGFQETSARFHSFSRRFPKILAWILLVLSIGSLHYFAWWLSYEDIKTYAFGFTVVGALTSLVLFLLRVLWEQKKPVAMAATTMAQAAPVMMPQGAPGFAPAPMEAPNPGTAPVSALNAVPTAAPAGAPAQVSAKPSRRFAWLSTLANLSYGIYLFHWPLFIIFHQGLAKPLNQHLAVCLSLALSLFLAWFSQKFWEPLFVNALKEPKIRPYSIWASRLALVLTGILFISLLNQAPVLTDFSNQLWQMALKGQISDMGRERLGVQNLE